MKPVVLITRPADGGARFAAALAEAFGGDSDIILSPVMEPIRSSERIDVPDGITLIFTSIAAVESVSEMAFREDTAAYCVGDRTTAAAQAIGLNARMAGQDVAALVATIERSGENGPFLYLRGHDVTGDIVGQLQAVGKNCTQQVVYEQREISLNAAAVKALEGASPVVLPVFSARSGRLIEPSTGGGAPVHVIAISQTVAEEFAHSAVVTVDIAPTPDLDGMVAATRRRLQRLSTNDVA